MFYAAQKNNTTMHQDGQQALQQTMVNLIVILFHLGGRAARETSAYRISLHCLPVKPAVHPDAFVSIFF